MIRVMAFLPGVGTFHIGEFTTLARATETVLSLNYSHGVAAYIA